MLQVSQKCVELHLMYLITLKQYLVWFNAPRATDFREKRNPPQADSIVSVL